MERCAGIHIIRHIGLQQLKENTAVIKMKEMKFGKYFIATYFCVRLTKKKDK